MASRFSYTILNGDKPCKQNTHSVQKVLIASGACILVGIVSFVISFLMGFPNISNMGNVLIGNLWLVCGITRNQFVPVSYYLVVMYLD